MASYFETGSLREGGPLFRQKVFADDAKNSSQSEDKRSFLQSVNSVIDEYCPSHPAKVLLITGMYVHSPNFPTFSHFANKAFEAAINGNEQDTFVYGTSATIYLGLVGITLSAISYANRKRITFRDLTDVITKG